MNEPQKNEAARNYASNEMKKMGIELIPSSTNFIFYPVKKYTGNYAGDIFDKHKILLRSNNYSDGQWARVSVGTMEEMEIFCSTLKSFAG